MGAHAVRSGEKRSTPAKIIMPAQNSIQSLPIMTSRIPPIRVTSCPDDSIRRAGKSLLLMTAMRPSPGLQRGLAQGCARSGE